MMSSIIVAQEKFKNPEISKPDIDSQVLPGCALFGYWCTAWAMGGHNVECTTSY